MGFRGEPRTIPEKIAYIEEQLRRLDHIVVFVTPAPVEHTHPPPDISHTHYLHAIFTFPGTAAVQTGGPRFEVPLQCTILNVRASVNVAPTGASLIVDVNKNGTTIFTTQANRPTIAVSTFRDMADAVDVINLIEGDYLQPDIDQIGSTIAGEDVTIQVLMALVE